MIKKLPKCKVCGERFTPFNNRTTVPYCMQKDECISAFVKLSKAKTEKEKVKKDKQETKILKEKLKTHKDYLQDLQKVFNTYIRERDKGKPCISCGTTSPNIRYDAGHFYSVGAYPNLRFNEFNVHRQCSNNCNLNKSGNFAEYLINLPERIGQDNFNKLQELRKERLQISIPEIKEKIKEYKLKIKQL